LNTAACFLSIKNSSEPLFYCSSFLGNFAQKIDQMYAAFTGQSLVKVQQYTERDRFLSVSEVMSVNASLCWIMRSWCSMPVLSKNLPYPTPYPFPLHLLVPVKLLHKWHPEIELSLTASNF
jgi:hypothetical protein